MSKPAGKTAKILLESILKASQKTVQQFLFSGMVHERAEGQMLEQVTFKSCWTVGHHW
jgi:hypothetical protein